MRNRLLAFLPALLLVAGILAWIWPAATGRAFAQGGGGALDQGGAGGQAIPGGDGYAGAKTFAGCPADPMLFHPCALAKAKIYKVPRTPDGKPDFQGYWANAETAAPWDIEPHPTTFGIVGGPGDVVDPPDRKIPYTAAALAKRKDIIDNHPYDDPQAHCAPAGIPRQNYTPFGLQILQPPGYFVILYEAQHMYRVIPTDNRPHIPAAIKLWQGDSVGHWDGDTLVVDYTNTNGKHWFDMAGNFETPNLHVIERFTLVDPDTFHYEARIEDSTIYTRPWTMALPFARNEEKNYYLLEFACREGEHDLQHYQDDGSSQNFKGTAKGQ
jgi:hypothetical protein